MNTLKKQQRLLGVLNFNKAAWIFQAVFLFFGKLYLLLNCG